MILDYRNLSLGIYYSTVVFVRNHARGLYEDRTLTFFLSDVYTSRNNRVRNVRKIAQFYGIIRKFIDLVLFVDNLDLYLYL